MRVPTSVLLAVLAAAGLLALAPALVRRYDATERLAAERASSTARVLQRQRRRRTVPGRRPINPARQVTVTVPAPTGDPSPPERRLRLVTGRRPPRAAKRRGTPAVVRRRRVFAALVLLNAIELVGVVAVGPGFWISFAVTGGLLAVYLVHLRNRAIADRRRRRVQAREAAWLAARQAEVRREQARRAAARREAQRRLAAQREAVRRAAMGLDREPTDLPTDLPAAAGSVSYRRRGGLRGRAYEAGGRHHNAS
ncbi:divisome protein SepX/GlpR [Actinoplanes sp. G11-F43]|uniref:divisome protein SepX/GlpR n=1 Tax=Actinoplanes sp. G11-F43 TaxID=3424130 RepID=UPI003D32EA34